MVITREIFEKSINSMDVFNPSDYQRDFLNNALDKLSAAVIRYTFDSGYGKLHLEQINKLIDIELKRMNLEREDGETEYTVDDVADDIDMIARTLMQYAINKFCEICGFVTDASVIDIDAVAECACDKVFGARGWLNSEIIRCKEALAEAEASVMPCLVQGDA